MAHMPWVLAVLILFLMLVAGGAFLTVRRLAAGTANRDRPH